MQVPTSHERLPPAAEQLCCSCCSCQYYRPVHSVCSTRGLSLHSSMPALTASDKCPPLSAVTNSSNDAAGSTLLSPASAANYHQHAAAAVLTHTSVQRKRNRAACMSHAMTVHSVQEASQPITSHVQLCQVQDVSAVHTEHVSNGQHTVP
jgi:hypothetical protein